MYVQKMAAALLVAANVAFSFGLMCPTTNLQVKRVVFSRRMSMISQETQEFSDFSQPSRIALSSIASIGAAEAFYLTASKLSSTPVFENFCGTASACNNVLNGPYSTIPFVNIPLSAVALISYTIIAVLTASPLFLKSSDGLAARTTILMLTSAMAAFSAYLMVILTTVLHTSCPFCYLSAALSFSMAIIAWTQKVVPNPTSAFVVTTSSVAVSTFTSAFLFYATSIVSSDSAQASTAVAGQLIAASEASGRELEEVAVNMPPAIKKKSSERALLVAERLKSLDAKMYGAYWCSHCNNQKQVLGIEGSKMFTYVECDKEGFNSEAKLCRSKKVPGYPTWEIKGQLYPGEKELDELEKILTEAEKSI